MKIGIAQINSIAGDFKGNKKKILSAYNEAVKKGADLVVTPELSLFGYPILDLVLKKSFLQDGFEAMTELCEEIGEVGLLVGYIDTNLIDSAGKEEKLYRNAAALMQNKEIIGQVYKTLIPKYDVYDQQHYFEPSAKCEPLRFNGHKIGVMIGEDLWYDDLLDRPLFDRDPASELKKNRAQMLINMSASHFQVGKPQFKANLYEVIACGTNLPLLCCNAIGCNEQFIFDGHSLLLDPDGNALIQLPGFVEAVEVCDVTLNGTNAPKIVGKSIEHIYKALVLGIKDYTNKLGFEKAVIGLSGGVDSAVTVALAVEALGADNVKVMTLPSKHSEPSGIADALILASNLNVECESISISDSYDHILKALDGVIGSLPEDRTEQNIQSRIRNIFIMAASNKHGYLPLSTINKTDMFTGNYAVYGDNCIGMCVLGDVPKKVVYKLADYINSLSEVIPKSIIDKKPTPELSEGQLDDHIVPSYRVVDSIIEYYVIYGLSASEIINDFGFNESDVYWVQKRIDLNAWKRLQTPPVLRVTSPGYGRGRRIPITQGYIKSSKL